MPARRVPQARKLRRPAVENRGHSAIVNPSPRFVPRHPDRKCRLYRTRFVRRSGRDSQGSARTSSLELHCDGGATPSGVQRVYEDLLPTGTRRFGAIDLCRRNLRRMPKHGMIVDFCPRPSPARRLRCISFAEPSGAPSKNRSESRVAPRGNPDHPKRYLFRADARRTV